MNSSLERRMLFVLILVFSAMACQAQGNAGFEKQEITLLGRNGEVKINAEIAQTNEQRAQGLMYRRELADGNGMLFIFSQEQILSFWMKNTYIPLSIAYIAADGRILEIHDMRPHDETGITSSRPAMYALEVPQGWFGRAGIRTGDRLVTENINN